MKSGASRLAAGVAAAVVVAGALALVRSDEGGRSPQAAPAAPPDTSIAVTGDTVPPLSAPVSTTVVSTTMTTQGAIDSTAPMTDDEPAVGFIEGPAAIETVGGKSASAAGDGKDDPVVQVVTVTGATTSTIADDPAVDFGEASGPLQPKETTPTTSRPSGARGASGSSGEGRMYTWRDGDSTRQVWLEPDLMVKSDVPVGSLEDAVVEVEGFGRARSDGGGTQGGWPVFRSRSGSLMALPGGVLLALDPDWDEAETDAFFSRNGIKQSRVSELDYLPNGFYVETEPGFPSLDLANALAAQDGVELSSPNWWSEGSTR